ncbi:hypothetical protein [Cryptosporangium aurantiacum]|uniref:Thioesterase-like superfamily protein n=1 Tax=Cryptosporangium aurantiacum TaxID=134849 RepID=A0A1M7KQF4_9ACTN|nr:hypothetical protein [Cryptosporangium aurantiacum]SHM67685.1 hypothetical protein SAMN05443668_1011223 [Cryptosporangium aurantiacum]
MTAVRSAARPLRAVADGGGARRARPEADAWRPPELDQLVRALNLWRVGTGHFLAMAADPDWPSFPGPQLVAALVTAAERSVPGSRVRLVSWSPGAPPSARRSVRVSVDALSRGPSGDVTAELTVDQRDSARGPRRRHGHAVVLLTPGGGSTGAVVGRGSVGTGETVAGGLVPAELPALLAAGDLDRRLPMDPTTGRALLAYLGAALTAPPGCSPYPCGPSGARATVLASTVAFLADAGPGVGLALGRPGVAAGAGEAPSEGHAHAMTEFRTPSGVPVVQTSQALVLAP